MLLIEMALVFGGVIAWALWELFSLRRGEKLERSVRPPRP